MKSNIISILIVSTVMLCNINNIEGKSCTDISKQDKCKDKAGCKWTGAKKGCCKTKKKGSCSTYWDDGGCRADDYCNFNCKEFCVDNKKSGCAWNGKKCIYIPQSEYEYGYEYTTGIVEETNGILMYQSTVTVAANVEVSGFDKICDESKPVKGSMCAEGYPAVAMVCSAKRDVDTISNRLTLAKGTSVFGPNKKEIQTLQNIFKNDMTFKNSATVAGITIKNFWSGCDKNGLVTDNLGMDCGDWKSNYKYKSGILGNSEKVVSGVFKFWSSADCDTEQRLLCLCPRAKEN